MSELATPESPGPLRRNLSVWSAIGISIALLAPSMAANLTPQASAATVGRAVPLAFVVATLGVSLIAWTFVRLTQRFEHAGSVYGFVGATLGARAGLASGWALLGVYLIFSAITAVASGIFIGAFLDSTGLWHSPPDWTTYAFALLALAVVWTAASRTARSGTRSILSIEAITVALILTVSIVVLVKLATGDGAHGHHLEAAAFSVGSNTPLSAVFLGAVFGFLAFAGFEAAATLGEETRNPRRAIPRAILGTVLFAGAFFIFVTWIEVSAFGTSAQGIEEFINSGSLMDDISSTYLANWLGDAITLGVAVSAFGSALAAATGAARLVYAFARDGALVPALAKIDSRNGIPKRATSTVVGIVAVVIVILAATQLTPLHTFAYGGTVGVLILLPVYAAATVGAARFLFRGDTRIARWEVTVPALGLAVLAYTLYRNLVPYPTGAGAWLPPLAALWLALGIGWSVLVPRSTTKSADTAFADPTPAPTVSEESR